MVAASFVTKRRSRCCAATVETRWSVRHKLAAGLVQPVGQGPGRKGQRPSRLPIKVTHVDDHLVPAVGSEGCPDNLCDLADGLDISNDGLLDARLEGVACADGNDSSEIVSTGSYQYEYWLLCNIRILRSYVCGRLTIFEERRPAARVQAVNAQMQMSA